MIIYNETKDQFRQDVRSNIIDKKIYEKFQNVFGHRTGAAEVNSWKNSMLYMSNVLDDPSIPSNAGIAIEYNLPKSNKRIDFLISGKNECNEPLLLIIELKQWSEVDKTELPSVVVSFVGGKKRELPHPSYQAWSYAAYFEDFNEYIEENNVKLKPCAYLHNLEDDSVVRNSHYEDDLKKAPIFLRHDSQKLTDFIKDHVRYGDNERLLYEIDNGRIRPSKKLSDALANLLKGKPEFTLIDEQKVVFEKAMTLARKSQSSKKHVLIVNGGPGTGKSVVAVNLLVHLINEQFNSQYVTKNAAPREVFSTKLTGSMSNSRFKSLFVGSGTFTKAEENIFDALIVDEAHRLNEKSGLFANMGENQIKEIIKASKFSVFFLDENQKVSFDDIGSKDKIYHWCEKENAVALEIELASQFRCNGSNGYLAFLDHHLQIRETANIDLQDLDYDFRVCDSASELRDLIFECNKINNSSRLVAGYCWPWLSAKDPKKFDIVIDDFKMKWNLKSDGSSWIIKENSVNEVGCIHTCQGLEVDYIGVIIGPDFLIRNGVVVTNGLARPSQDKTVKGLRTLLKTNPDDAKKRVDEIIKNTYRTLMTRGMKGCYIYSVDKETNKYFQSLVSYK